MSTLPVHMKCALGLLPLEMLSEGLIHDLGDGQGIEVGLASDRVNPAPFDMEGDTLGLPAGIARLEQGGFRAWTLDQVTISVRSLIIVISWSS